MIKQARGFGRDFCFTTQRGIWVFTPQYKPIWSIMVHEYLDPELRTTKRLPGLRLEQEWERGGFYSLRI